MNLAEISSLLTPVCCIFPQVSTWFWFQISKIHFMFLPWPPLQDLLCKTRNFFLHLCLYQEPKVGKALFKKPNVSRKRSLFLLVFYYRMALLSACGTEGLMLLSMLIVFCIAIFLCLDLQPLLKVWFISSSNTWPMTENLVQMWCRTLRHEEDPLLMET